MILKYRHIYNEILIYINIFFLNHPYLYTFKWVVLLKNKKNNLHPHQNQVK